MFKMTHDERMVALNFAGILMECLGANMDSSPEQKKGLKASREGMDTQLPASLDFAKHAMERAISEPNAKEGNGFHVMMGFLIAAINSMMQAGGDPKHLPSLLVYALESHDKLLTEQRAKEEDEKATPGWGSAQF